MDIETITQLIQGVGFPIFVAVWLLWRFDGMLDRMSQQLQQVIDLLDSTRRERPHP